MFTILTCVGGPALIDADVLHQLADDLVDGVVPEIASQLGGVCTDQRSLAAEIVLVDKPGLAVLQSESLANLSLCSLQTSGLCSELKLLGKVDLLQLGPPGHVMGPDVLHELLVRDGVDLQVGPSVDDDHHLDVLDTGLGALEHVLACVGSVVVQILHHFGLEGSIPHLSHQQGALPRVLLGLFVADHLGEVG